MVQIPITMPYTRVVHSAISTCGYSPLAIILTFTLSGVIAAGGVVIRCFQYPAGMPIASSCSAAISAACHPPPRDADASLSPIQ
ncbi:hypothetical protein BCR34DRAFT_642675, partial [Clohesyomyces aquaticus]